jgi:hypothetical protein
MWDKLCSPEYASTCITGAVLIVNCCGHFVLDGCFKDDIKHPIMKLDRPCEGKHQGWRSEFRCSSPAHVYQMHSVLFGLDVGCLQTQMNCYRANCITDIGFRHNFPFNLIIYSHYGKVFQIKVYEGVSKSFRTGRLERELQRVQLSATSCSCIAIL